MATLIFSYAHKDEPLRDELAAHLAPLRREGLIETWHDRRIVAGQPLDDAIGKAFDVADVILLLVSPDFINSDYCYEIEVRHAMDRHRRSDAVVIPVILRPCDWHGLPFGHLLAVPRDGKAVTSWANRDEAFHDAARSIRAALERRDHAQPRGSKAAPRETSRDVRSPSRNLALPKRFSEKDEDDFLHESFGRIAEFFEDSLRELERANSGVETRFSGLDARRFTAVAYRDGRPTSRCTIWLGAGLMKGIGYVENDSGETNSFNENLSVEVGDQALYLKPLGMAFIGQERMPDRLDAGAAAEFLWGLFMRRLRQG